MAQANPIINQQTQEEPVHYEVEFLESFEKEKESALHDKWKNCQKDLDHSGFIPVEKFQEHLLESHCDPLYLDYIMAVISLTVRLVVRYVSRKRPDEYPLSQNGGEHGRYFGSGRVRWVERKFTDMDGERCPCPQCSKRWFKIFRKKQWGKFWVVTAKHVVYNDEESRHTQVDVDYNTDIDRDTCPKLQGVGVMGSSVEKDWCMISVVSHDRNVCLMLEERVRLYHDLKNKYRGKRESNDPPIVCVSHPHGMSKHVSVGEWKGQQKDRPHNWKYTTSTCPGSSGAPICKLGERGMTYGYITHHSGCTTESDVHVGLSGRWGWKLSSCQ